MCDCSAGPARLELSKADVLSFIRSRATPLWLQAKARERIPLYSDLETQHDTEGGSTAGTGDQQRSAAGSMSISAVVALYRDYLSVGRGCDCARLERMAAEEAAFESAKQQQDLIIVEQLRRQSAAPPAESSAEAAAGSNAILTDADGGDAAWSSGPAVTPIFQGRIELPASAPGAQAGSSTRQLVPSAANIAAVSIAMLRSAPTVTDAAESVCDRTVPSKVLQHLRLKPSIAVAVPPPSPSPLCPFRC